MSFMNFSPKDKVVQSPDCASQIIKETAVIIYPKERTIHRLNSIGTSIWQFIEKERTTSEIWDFILHEYDIDIQTVRKDVQELLSDLVDKKLVKIISPTK